MVAAGVRKRLDAALHDARKLFLDTSVVIAYLKGNEATSQIAAVVLDDYVRGGRLGAAVSVLTLTELLVQPLRMKRDVDTILDFAYHFPHLELVPIDEAAALAAAQVRAQHNLKAADAIIVGSAQCNGEGTYLLTNDRAWMPVTQVPVRALDAILNPSLHQ